MPKPKMKSYKTLEIKIPAELVDPIRGVTSTPGTWQRPFQHIQSALKQIGNDWVARVRDSDITDMKKLSVNPDAGSYQRWSDEILKLNGLN